MTDKVPEFMVGKHQLVATVLFTSFFALVTMLLMSRYFPWTWFSLGEETSYGFTLAFVAAVIVFISISKRIFYQFGKSGVTYLVYILWNVAEVMAVSLMYSAVAINASSLGLAAQDAEFVDVFPRSLIGCILSLGIPYILANQYFAISDRDKTIRLMNYGSTVTDMDLTPQQEKRVTLFDNSGVIKLSVTMQNLFYVESDDNYVKVWYTDSSGELKQYMLRCRLKTIEDSFSDSDLVRCHR
ncbi:MAG: LytTR family transcriptional regulator, partial [Bacteroidales bacterium]|nr:LytTR family transcriptional regulator [Bacteroidales bacterium]